ncbi:RHS repeat-associated core domain-containing protein [Vibrio azureus]|uniref:RHS repeat-associated core domain-containing protein n=1 Tax=Vibrio azureus TaxID=512649 RepID=UPI001C3F3497|nr:RHS repeat-associated core domain-containing protein [Vibrio azureus]
MSRSVSIAITATCSLNALSVFAKTFNLDEDDLITLFSHEFTGFNGETLDPVTGNYMLGNGYRAYNPTLIRFMSQDSLSPFSEAGINAYQYCSGDPINRSDPSGHLDGLKLGLGIFAVLVGIAGAIAAPFTGGTSLAIAAGVIGSAAGAISGGLSIAAAVVAERNPDVADKLDIASWAFTGISLVAGAVGAAGGIYQGTKAPGFISKLSKGRLGQSRLKVDIKFRPKGQVKARRLKADWTPNDKYALKNAQSVTPVSMKNLKTGEVLKAPETLDKVEQFGSSGFMGSRMIKTYTVRKSMNSWKEALTISKTVIDQVGAIGSGGIGLVIKANALAEKQTTLPNQTFVALSDRSANQYVDRVSAPGLSRTSILNIETNPASINSQVRQGIFTA